MRQLKTARQAGLRRCRSWPLVLLLAGGPVPALAGTPPCEPEEAACDASRVELQAPERSYRWETGFNRESLDNGAEDWQNIYAYIDRRWPGNALASLTVTEHRRFSLSDKELTVGGAIKPADRWLLSAAVSTVPDAAFLPETMLHAGASRQLPGGWVAGVDLRYRSYPQQSVRSAGLRLERYFGNFRAAYHLEQTRLASAASWSHRGVLNWYAESGSRYGLTVAAGQEIELIAPGQLLEMDISAIALSGRHPVSERLSIIWRVGTHRQGSIYRRNNLGLSLAGEF